METLITSPVVAATGNNLQTASSRFAVVLLLAANTVPLVGVLLFDWSVFDVLATFWLDSLVIGCLNLVKILRVGGSAGLFSAFFFVLHYAAFSIVHLLFIVSLFYNGRMGGLVPPSGDPVIPFSSFGAPAWVIGTYWVAGLSYLVSHSYSLVVNFFARREWRYLTIRSAMMLPYGRVIVMHLTILVGGFLTVILRQPVWAVLLLVVLKAGLDLRAHLHQHHTGRKVEYGSASG